MAASRPEDVEEVTVAQASEVGEHGSRHACGRQPYDDAESDTLCGVGAGEADGLRVRIDELFDVLGRGGQQQAVVVERRVIVFDVALQPPFEVRGDR